MSSATGSVMRVVGVCSHCGGNVLLRVQHGLPVEREASCPCGSTVIPAGFFRAARAKTIPKGAA